MIFDLHCDTLYEINEKGGSLDSKKFSVNLNDMLLHNGFTRLFAVYTPDTLKGQDAKNHFNNLYNIFINECQKHSDKLTRITDFENLEKSQCNAVLSVENASVLAGDLKEIERLSKLGVKVLSFTWNGENELAFGQLENRGLKPFGKECIPVCEKNDIVIDVSHLSDRGFEDICAFSTKPFVATHSNSRKICNHKRNLLDEQIVEIIKRGGLIGLNFYRDFLREGSKGANKYDILKHTEHILSLGGENVLSIGTDFDGADMIDDFKSDKDLLSLRDFFTENGLSEKITDKILFENAYKFFTR